MDNVSNYILFKICKYINYWRDLEKLENLNNGLNDKMRYINDNFKMDIVCVNNQCQLYWISKINNKYKKANIKVLNINFFDFH